MKHGLTGDGVVLPTEDVAAVARRFEALDAELSPSNTLASILVQRVAMLSVRLERCVKQEATKLAETMRHAASDFDDRRMTEVEAMMETIVDHPETNARRLRRTPEGVDRLIKAWLDLIEELDQHDLGWWGHLQWQRIENLKGLGIHGYPISRYGAICKVIWNDSSYLAPGELDGVDPAARREWARDRLRERMLAEVAELRELRATFDVDALALDRREAASRAMFDPSKEAILARKYEAAAERGLYRALKELREVEAEARIRPEPDATPDGEEICETVASFCTEPEGDSPADDPGPSEPSREPRSEGPIAVEPVKPRPKSAGRGRRGPS